MSERRLVLNPYHFTKYPEIKNTVLVTGRDVSNLVQRDISTAVSLSTAWTRRPLKECIYLQIIEEMDQCLKKMQ